MKNIYRLAVALFMVFTVGVLVTVNASANAKASASSPYGCWNWEPYEDVCYQIVGPGGDFVNYFRGLIGNGHDVAIPAAVKVTGPGFAFSYGVTVPAGHTWYWQWNVDANMRVGTYCATYYSYGNPDFTRCYLVK